MLCLCKVSQTWIASSAPLELSVLARPAGGAGVGFFKDEGMSSHWGVVTAWFP